MSGYVPKLIQQTMNKQSGEIITALDWNTIFNLLITQGDDTAVNLESLYNIIYQNYSDTQKIKEMLDEKIVEIGAGDMPKSIYDTDNDGIVNIAASVIANAIATNHIQANAVTEAKLASAVQTKLNKVHSAMFKIDYAKATSTTNGATSDRVQTNKTHFFNLGFTPKAVLVFNTDTISEDHGSNYVRENVDWYAHFAHERYYEYSDYENKQYDEYGGFATTGSPATGFASNMELFSITTNGVNFRQYASDYEASDGGDRTYNINLQGSFCIAIG